MAWTDVTITRADIDKVERQAFEGYTSGGSLNISDNDTQILEHAKQELESDLIESIHNKSYATEVALLDALETADDRNVLKTMLLYKFLELFFYADAPDEDSFKFRKAITYANKYGKRLRSGINQLQPKLATPEQPTQFELITPYG